MKELHEEFMEQTGDKAMLLTIGNVYYHTAYVRWLERKLMETKK